MTPLRVALVHRDSPRANEQRAVGWWVMGFLRTIGRAQPDVLLMECWGNKGPRGLVGVVRREGERVPCD